MNAAVVFSFSRIGQPFQQNGLIKPYFSNSVSAIVKKRLKVYF